MDIRKIFGTDKSNIIIQIIVYQPPHAFSPIWKTPTGGAAPPLPIASVGTHRRPRASASCALSPESTEERERREGERLVSGGSCKGGAALGPRHLSPSCPWKRSSGGRDGGQESSSSSGRRRAADGVDQEVGSGWLWLCSDDAKPEMPESFLSSTTASTRVRWEMRDVAEADMVQR